MDSNTSENSSQSHLEFQAGEMIVYPAHGVGTIKCIENTEAAGYKLEMYVVNFHKEKLLLKVPVSKVESAGMRKLSTPNEVDKAFAVLKGKAKVKRTMWSRRAQEYETKINSGDIMALSEVVRDLYRSPSQSDPSFSERQIYDQARQRLTREIAAVYDLDDEAALEKIENTLHSVEKNSPSNDSKSNAAANSDIAAA